MDRGSLTVVFVVVKRVMLQFVQISIFDRVSEQCFTSPPTQYRLYERRFLQVKRPNQQYQSTKGDATKEKEKKRKQLNTDIHRQKCTHKTIYTK